MDERKFYCYSIQLKDFLKLRGVFYEDKGYHKKTGNHFWIYSSSESLDRGLSEWNKYKEIFGKESSHANRAK